MISILLPRATLAFLLVSMLCTPAMAQVKRTDASAEDIAIAFFKTAETNPDFDLWAGNTSKYKSAAPARGKATFVEEKQRLIRLWNEFDPKLDTIDILTTVNVELKATTDEKGTDHYALAFDFSRDDSIYFPYSYQDYKFAVIPQMMDKMLVQPLPKAQYEMIRQKIGSNGKAVLFFQLKPVKAYIQQPYMIDNMEQWMFLCDIVSLSLKTPRDGAILWSYGADWYVAPETEKLRDLYKSHRESATPF